jgi:hypothetical protein
MAFIIKVNGDQPGPTPGPDQYTKLLLHADEEPLADFSGNDQGVFIIGNTEISSAQSKFGGASMYFDEVSSWVSIVDNDDFDLSTGDFTIDCWVRLYLDSGFAPICANRTVQGIQGFAFGVNTPNGKTELYCKINTSWYGPLLSTTSTVASDGDWHHIALVRYNDDWTIYVDGVSSASTTQAGTLEKVDTNLVIGADASSPTDTLQGYIDEFRISKGIARWTENFTPPTEAYPGTTPVPYGGIDSYTKLMLHGDESPLVDSSLSPKTLQLVGQVRTNSTYVFGGYSFSCWDNPITISSDSDFSPGGQDFTIDAWMSRSSNGIYAGILQKATVSGNFEYIFRVDPFTNSLRFYAFSTGVDEEPKVDITGSTAFYSGGGWNHVAIVRNGNTWTLYLNGVNDGSTTSSIDIYTGNADVYVGNGAKSNLDEVRFSKGIARWTSNFTPPDRPYTTT